jgi:hypothetical protein
MTASTASSNLPPPAGRATSRWPRPLTGNEEEPHALAAPPQQPQTRRLDAGATMLRLRALQAMGHSSARIARVIGTSGQVLQRIVRSDAKTVTPAIHDAVAAIYDAWWDKRPPGRSRGERAAATAARRRATAGNWCTGAGLDDDQLDVPGYRPAHGWKAASGTGTATGPPAQARQIGLGA